MRCWKVTVHELGVLSFEVKRAREERGYERWTRRARRGLQGCCWQHGFRDGSASFCTASRPCSSLIDMHAFVSHARPGQRSVHLSFGIFCPKCLSKGRSRTRTAAGSERSKGQRMDSSSLPSQGSAIMSRLKRMSELRRRDVGSDRRRSWKAKPNCHIASPSSRQKRRWLGSVRAPVSSGLNDLEAKFAHVCDETRARTL